MPAICFSPKKWMVFPLVANTFVPEKKILTSIPAAFGSVKGKETEMLSNTLDFAKITGKTGMKNCSWAFAELQCPLDQYEYTFGMGADWYMALYVNGKEVLSTIKRGGNLKHPPAIDDHQVTVKLKKGRNILAVKFLSGSTSAIFKWEAPKIYAISSAPSGSRNGSLMMILTAPNPGRILHSFCRDTPPPV